MEEYRDEYGLLVQGLISCLFFLSDELVFPFELTSSLSLMKPLFSLPFVVKTSMRRFLSVIIQSGATPEIKSNEAKVYASEVMVCSCGSMWFLRCCTGVGCLFSGDRRE